MQLPETDAAFWQDCRDWRTSNVPPLAVVAALFSLAGGSRIEAVFSEFSPREDDSIWRLVAVTSSLLIELEFSASDENWNFDSSSKVSVTKQWAVAWPLGSVTAVRATTINLQSQSFGSDMRWDAEYRIDVADRVLAMPRWQRPHSESGRNGIQAVVDAVLAGMSPSACQ